MIAAIPSDGGLALPLSHDGLLAELGSACLETVSYSSPHPYHGRTSARLTARGETPKNPVTRTGNLWVLGKHRIVCGDSTDQKTVERLLDGAEPDLMVTDPPYGVNYDATWRYKAGVSTKDGAFGKSVNDDQNNW